VLLDGVKDGRTIVQTSHSTIECEAMCTRLGIKVNGQFKCLGSPQHLKSWFGVGVSRTAKLSVGSEQEELAELTARVIAKFPGAVVKEEHFGMVRFVIEKVPWSVLFGEMERIKHGMQLEDYSVTQATLEQVFLECTAAQEAEIRPPV
jgi:ATP-binding cassette subfamily A (ABC1) protein 3